MALNITIYSQLRQVSKLQSVGGGSHGIGELILVGGGWNWQCERTNAKISQSNGELED